MLNTARFKDREEGIAVFFRLIEFLIKKEGGTIKKRIIEVNFQGGDVTSDGSVMLLHKRIIILD